MRVIIAHAGQQTSFRRAEALKSGDLLFKYITSLYLKKSYSSTVKFFQRFELSDVQRLMNRNCAMLDDDDVVTFNSLRGLLLVALNRVSKKRECYNKLNYRFSTQFAVRTARYAVRNDVDILVMMGAAPYAAFTFLNNQKSRIAKVFDMSSIAYNFQTKIMQEERRVLPQEWQDYITRDRDAKLNEKLMRNISSADHIIVSSNFAFQSLVANNVTSERIHVIPYGIENNNQNHHAVYKANERLNLLFVGSVSCEKGVYYLLEAVKRFPPEKVFLTVVGKKYISDALLKRFLKNVKFVGDVPSARMPEFYRSSHVLVVPTLFDSFGRVITEALSFGLPVITTSSAGAADYIVEGENGFVIPPSNIDAIMEKISFFLDNPDKVELLGKNGSLTASAFTWERYYSNYCKTMSDIYYSQRN